MRPGKVLGPRTTYVRLVTERLRSLESADAAFIAALLGRD